MKMNKIKEFYKKYRDFLLPIITGFFGFYVFILEYSAETLPIGAIMLYIISIIAAKKFFCSEIRKSKK